MPMLISSKIYIKTKIGKDTGFINRYIFDLYDKLKKIVKKESSKEKRKKIRIIGEELRIEYGRK